MVTLLLNGFTRIVKINESTVVNTLFSHKL